MAQHRLEQILINLARRYAPELVPVTWLEPGDYTGRLSELATALADYNVLIMAGIVPPERAADPATQVANWVQSYVRLYDTLARALFPSFAQISAFYADYEQPPIVFLRGAATPVILVLARTIAPYVAARQGSGTVSDFELTGIMESVLDELEAGDLPRDQLRQLRDDSAAQLRQLLGSVVRQHRLTNPKPALARAFGLQESADADWARSGGDTLTMPMPPESPSPTNAPAPPPDVLPEQDRFVPTSAPEAPDNPFGASIPIFFDPNARGKRPPPVPDLPENPS